MTITTQAHIPSDSVVARNALEGTQDAEESSPLLINPTMAEDVDVVERQPYLSHADTASPDARRYVRVSNTPGESIVYRVVPRRRAGLQSASNPGIVQREVMEQILGELKTDVIRLFVVENTLSQSP